jgi:hypothetical protein
MDFVELLRARDIAIEQAAANEQHYEVRRAPARVHARAWLNDVQVSTEFIQSCLGPWMKARSARAIAGSALSRSRTVLVLPLSDWQRDARRGRGALVALSIVRCQARYRSLCSSRTASRRSCKTAWTSSTSAAGGARSASISRR